LVRPDFVIFDEVRRSNDFKIFADMRLAGIGLIGVTHANRAIDAIQRLVGRVELGMIPQVVDTVIHIVGGVVKEILELEFTVKIPYGMEEADLARPVIVVKNFYTKKILFEIYSYGEQVVVMPVGEKKTSPMKKLAEGSLKKIIKKYIDGNIEVKINDGSATVYVEEPQIPYLIGRGGKTISKVEEEAGIKINVEPFESNVVTPHIVKRKKDVVLKIGKVFSGRIADVILNGEVVYSSKISTQGDIKIGRSSKMGKKLIESIASEMYPMVKIK